MTDITPRDSDFVLKLFDSYIIWSMSLNFM